MANMCRNIEAELSNLPRAASQHASNRAAQEAQRLWGHMRSIGCDRQNFLFMGTPPPPECAGMRAQLGTLQMRSQMAADGGETRRRQLLSMQISNNCRTSPEPMITRRSEPLVAGLFDDAPRRVCAACVKLSACVCVTARISLFRSRASNWKMTPTRPAAWPAHQRIPGCFSCGAKTSPTPSRLRGSPTLTSITLCVFAAALIPPAPAAAQA
jgi:hypothetical protein